METSTKRNYIKVLQQRTYAPKSDGFGMEWKPRIEKKYEFENVEEFIKEFNPKKSSEDLLNAINKAYLNCDSVVFNAGNGNETFTFSK